MRYLIFYKPYGVLCQFSSEDTNHPTLKSYISIPSVYPVGRLDRDSEGLLLLSDDGKLQHYLCEPKYGHLRTYWVQVEGIPSQEAIASLRSGVKLKDGWTRRARVELLLETPSLPDRIPPIRERKHIPTSWLEISLSEGRNRQVRRMTAAVSYPTLRLVRVAIASYPKPQQDSPHFPTNPHPILTLDALSPGEWRELSERERQGLKQLIANPKPQAMTEFSQGIRLKNSKRRSS
ncbi:pseudouridine synthase [Oscillatoria sp. FACHB-1406]|uniref:pseudouridine synthase n=1 Tax=Oscillatoria sp. FACHB-1406 TaxID=2692846 RepID=UPI001F54BABF|nr:pseudouridine synthase [Oscillatoria sp. FACHB-1406]